jgi:subtilisin-like proprotein convertase family protein
MDAKHRAEIESVETSRPSRRAFLGLALGGLAVLAGIEVTAAKPKHRLKKQAKKGKLKSKGKLSASAKRRAPRRPKFKTVTKTFSNGSPITISATTGAASPFPSEIKVAGFKQGKLLDVNVTLSGLSHTFPEDLDIQLESPNLRRAVIMSDVGDGTDVSNLTLTLDDQAAALLPPNSVLGSGTFKPTNDGLVDAFPPPAAPSSDSALSTFNGINPNGSWKLYVVDDFATADGGSFAGGWSLTLKARVRV